MKQARFYPWLASGVVAAEVLLGAMPEPSLILPAPFGPSRYELLKEYSPFVKSIDPAKGMEKSLDLVVVGYGRVRGEDHVIVQQKDISTKREKIGSRFGSKDFPYRLLSVTNTSNRKTFKALLEDRNRQPLEIRYATEVSSSAPSAGGGGDGAGASASPSPGAGLGASSGTTNKSDAGTNSGKAASLGEAFANIANLLRNETPESIQTKIKNLEAKLDNPATPEDSRVRIQEAIEREQKKLQTMQSPQDLQTDEISPEGP